MATSIACFSFQTPLLPRSIKPNPASPLRSKRQPSWATTDGSPRWRRNQLAGRCMAYKVTIEHAGERRSFEVDDDETILGRALEEGLEVPHDCKLGVCMTCPARLLSGAVDQSEGMLSEDVVARGYALLCSAYPRSDCVIRTIPEDELLSLQLATAND